MNVLEHAMRDDSTDELTGWLFGGNYYERYVDLSTGMSGLGELGQVVAKLPRVGQRYVREALRDPITGPIVRQLLRSPNPDEALSRQAEADVAEVAHPTGKVVVFKELAARLASKVKAAENAVMNALPGKNTEEAEVARIIIATSDNPQKELKQFYTDLAAEAVGVDLAETDETGSWTSEEAMSGLSMSKRWKKRLKAAGKVLKYAAIATAAVIAAPLVISAVGSVGGAIVGGVKSIFGGGAAAPPAAPPPTDQYVDPGAALEARMAAEKAAEAAAAAPAPAAQIPWDKLASLGVKVVKYRQAQAQAKAANNEADASANAQAAQQVHQEAVQSLVQQGVPQAQAEQYVTQAEQQAQAQMPAPPPGEAPSAAMAVPGAPPAGFPVLPLVILGGVVLLAMSGKGGGGRSRRSRRNPRRYYRSWRRRSA